MEDDNADVPSDLKAQEVTRFRNVKLLNHSAAGIDNNGAALPIEDEAADSDLKDQESTRHQSLGELRKQAEIPPPNVPEGEAKDIVGGKGGGRLLS